MMGEACEDCGKWAEDIYWTHFHFTHFAKILPTGFDQQLVIPSKFLLKLKKILPSLVVLKGPSGINWTVELVTHEDSYCFKRGWSEFANDHDLKENDLLIFKYNGDSLFNVLLFDGSSFCEKESSYFVQKCKHAVHVTEKKPKETHLVGLSPNSNIDVECSSENLIDNDNVEEHSPENESEGEQIERTVRPKRNRITRQSSTATGILSPTSSKTIVSFSERYTSNRRPITDTEIARAFTMAEAASTENTCRIIMRPSHVYRKFFLFIPTAWMKKHLSSQSQDIILRVAGASWLTRFQYYRGSRNGGLSSGWKCASWLTRFQYYRGSRNGGLSSGWKCFAVDNNLEAYDVCLFDLASETSDSRKILDVRIFRVVEEVAPQTLVSAPPKKN